MAHSSASWITPMTGYDSDEESYPRSSASRHRGHHYDHQRIVGTPSASRSRTASRAGPSAGPSSPSVALPTEPSWFGDDTVVYHRPSTLSSYRRHDTVATPPIPPPTATSTRLLTPDDAASQRRLLEEKRQSQRSSWPLPTSTTNPPTTADQSTIRRRLSGTTVETQQDLAEITVPSTAKLPPSNVDRVDFERSTARVPDNRNPSAAASAPAQAGADFLPHPPSRGSLESKKATATEPSTSIIISLYTISYLVFFSILGTLARLGVQWLTFYPGAPVVTPVVWANFGGSLILGFLAEDEQLFSAEWLHTTPPSEKRVSAQSEATVVEDLDRAEKTKRKKAIPLYIGLATGFCGSFTSFSSFARDFFLALSNDLPTPISHPSDLSVALSTTNTLSRNGGYSFLAFLGVVLYTILLSLGALIFGAHLASGLRTWTPVAPARFTRRFVDPLGVFLGWGCWLGALLLAIFPPDRSGGPSSGGSESNETWRGEVLFALVFAPVGCIARWWLSLKLNGLVPAFPLGTFAVNMFGTAVEGMCWDIQHVGIGLNGMIGGGLVGCQVLQGVQDGFCGCLTTVSTWVAEIHGLSRKHGYIYGCSSIVGGLCLLLVIMGSVRWGHGWDAPTCSTGYVNKIYG